MTAERRLAALLDDLEQAHRVARADPERAARLRRVAEQLEHSLADVRDLAAGLHPRELATGGLGGALEALAARSPVPVELELGLPAQLSAEAERAAYFVCSEGLANVAKYAEASRARVHVGSAGGRLVVEVEDDGRGGADPGGGTGLRGLADRVEALGGALAIDSRSRRWDPPGGRASAHRTFLTGGPMRFHGDDDHTSRSPMSIGGTGMRSSVPSGRRLNVKVLV